MGVVLSRSKQRRKSEEFSVVLDMLCRVVAGAYLVGIVSASRLLQGRHDVYAAPLPFVREHDVAWRQTDAQQQTIALRACIVLRHPTNAFHDIPEHGILSSYWLLFRKGPVAASCFAGSRFQQTIASGDMICLLLRASTTCQMLTALDDTSDSSPASTSISPAIPSNRIKLIDNQGGVGEIGSAPGIVRTRCVVCSGGAGAAGKRDRSCRWSCESISPRLACSLAAQPFSRRIRGLAVLSGVGGDGTACP
jgi:hypothetical protein